MTQKATAGRLVRWAAEQLTSSPTAMLDARTLFLFVSGWTHDELIAQDEDVLSDLIVSRYLDAVQRRANAEPVAYITGQQEFFGRTFSVTSDVLIPRPETEMLVEAALHLSPSHVLDLGVGSGCLLGSILAACPTAKGEGWDISTAALFVAQQNLEQIGVADRATLLPKSFENAVDRRFDLIVSNPPYIEEGSVLPVSVKAYEPPIALYAGADGLAAYRLLGPSIHAMLLHEGTALLEIGTGQGEAVSAIMRDVMPHRTIRVLKDLAGHERMVEIGPEQ